MSESVAGGKQRLTPTLFDKLVADIDMAGLMEAEADKTTVARETFRFYTVPQIERFNEAALRGTIKRELAWLLNTTNFGATQSLEHYPRVENSVLNYGLPDMAGKAVHRRSVLQRAREIRDAVRHFEPRIDPKTLVVEMVEREEREQKVTFIIQGDISTAAQSMPVKLYTRIDPDSAAVDVEE